MTRIIFCLLAGMMMVTGAAGFGTVADPHVPDVISSPTTGGFLINAIVSDGRYAYVGGMFTHAGGLPRKNLAAFDLRTGEVDPDWNVPTDYEVRSLLVVENRLYVAGAYTRIGNISRYGLAAVELAGSGRTGRVDPSWWPMPRIWGTSFYSITTDGTYIYGATDLTIHAYPKSTGANSAVADPNWEIEFNYFDSLVGPVVMAAGGRLYVGGGFTELNDTTGTQYLAAVELAGGGRTGRVDPNWKPLSSSIKYDRVRALATDGKYIYAGGVIRYSLTSREGGLRAFEPSDGLSTGAMVADWRPDTLKTSTGGSTVTAQVTDLLYHQGKIIAVGDFVSIGGQRRYSIAVLPPAGEGRSGTPDVWILGLSTVTAIGASGEGLFVGGKFTKYGGVDHFNLLGFDTVPRSGARDWMLFE